MSDKIKQALLKARNKVSIERESCPPCDLAEWDYFDAALASLDAQPEAEQPQDMEQFLFEFFKANHGQQRLIVKNLYTKFSAPVAAPIQPASKPEAWLIEGNNRYKDVTMRQIVVDQARQQGYNIIPLTRCDTSKEAKCSTCNGNDGDMPCAYPSKGMTGCLRDARLGNSDAPKQEPVAWCVENPHGDDPSVLIYGNGAVLKPGDKLYLHPVAQPCQSMSNDDALEIWRQLGHDVPLIGSELEMFLRQEDITEFARAVRGEPAKTGEV